jgi:Abnormal spindle-like microcephaly-assoc'd, ASPM-SPD-2-Hydin
MRNRKAYRRNWQGAILALVATALSVACGGGMAQNHVAGNPTAAGLTMSASSVDFGNVSVGSSQNKSLILTNSSPSRGASVTFSNVTASGAGFTVSTTPLPVRLAPGQTSTVTITFAPTNAGAATGGLTVTVAGAPEPAMVPLTGTGVGAAQSAAAQLAVSPSTLNFGSVAVGSSKNQTGMLTAGTSDVNVASAAWNGSGYSVSGITFPVTVRANQSLPFTVTFAPQVSGSSPGSISFSSNASNSPTNEALAGTGTQTASGLQHTVSLTWNPSTSSVAGYNVYRGTQSGGPYSKLNALPETSTSYADNSVQSGATYYYVATSVDSTSVESSYSNQVTAQVPTP